MDTAHRYRAFAIHEARGVSPHYEEFALGVSQDREIIAFLDLLPEPKRQPNLLFGCVKYLTGVLPSYSVLREFVLSRRDDVWNLMLSRSTQTNEPGRCAVLLPLLATLRQPLALLEAGAAAGLCLLPDRYGYRYGDKHISAPGAAPVFRCDPVGSVPLPVAMPRVTWRLGIDLNPLNPSDADTVSWLRALVWADNAEREERLVDALATAAKDPPMVKAGDILEMTAPLAAGAPSGATLVVFHSAVLPYLLPNDRRRFVELVSELPSVWISFEGRGALPSVDAKLPRDCRVDDGSFVLALNGEPVATANPHGRWLRWLDGAGSGPPSHNG